MDEEGGQATVEVVAAIPALVLAGLIALQFLAVGYSLTLADGAAEAGALAAAVDRPPQRAAREALPGWARGRVGVDVDGGRITVTVRPPSPIPALSQRLAITSSAWVRLPAER